LREEQIRVPSRSTSALSSLPIDESLPPGVGDGHWRQADVKRAIEAARKAGIEAYRVEIAPDGTISIIVGG
jgi:hypothetical protein